MELNEKENPLVSVIVPSYNHERYITQCVESIINQTYKNWELIVIDDGSSDDSRTILDNLQKKYGFICCFKKNQGISATLNLGITHYSRGKYITFCASDDFWALDKLEKQVSFLEKNQFFPMCYGKSFYVDKNSTLLKFQPAIGKIFKRGDMFNDIFLFKIHPPVTYMFRADIFKEIGFYNEANAAEDYDMNLRISFKYKIGYIDEFLAYYRYDDSQLKVKRFEIISNSHLATIDEYKDHNLYSKAKAMVFLRKFDAFSGYKNLKIKALENLFNSLPLWYNRRFFFAIVKLFFFWKA
jgi:alpha-1,3-rhamnosyltransferase